MKSFLLALALVLGCSGFASAHGHVGVGAFGHGNFGVVHHGFGVMSPGFVGMGPVYGGYGSFGTVGATFGSPYGYGVGVGMPGQVIVNTPGFYGSFGQGIGPVGVFPQRRVFWR